MAFTRKFLTALGIEEDKVEEIISSHVEVVNALKSERDEYKTKADKLAETEKKLADANEKLAKNDEKETVLKSDYDAVKKELDDFKTKEISTAKEHAFRETLKAEKISDKWIDRIVKTSKDYIDGIELDEDRKPKDSKKLAEDIGKDWAEYKVEETASGATVEHPPAGNQSGTDLGSLSMEEYIKARSKK